MVTIIIKSFNRPHYLDRCLFSIQKNVSGKHSVKIIDDGTPEKYLKVIRRKHPETEILLTEKYREKSEQIENQQAVSGIIPSGDWYKTVENSSEYVLIIEDDVWFTDKINLDYIEDQMDQQQINLLKLGWNGMSLNRKLLVQISDILYRRKIKLFSLNSSIMNWLFANKFKIYSVLVKLKIIPQNEFYKYYVFISISSGIHRKEYWLQTWENLAGSVNEKQQIKNAVKFYKKNKTPNFISYYSNEIIKTTFKSSATNTFHKYGFNFDVNDFNYIINEAWFDDQFDSMQNYPADFSDDYIKQFLEKAENPKAKFENWLKWSEKFKEQYRNLGAQID